MIRGLFKKALFKINNNLFWFLLLRLSIRERTPEGKDKFVFFKKTLPGRKTLLSLDSLRFRGDLEGLSGQGKFKVFCLTQHMTGRLVRAIYGENINLSDIYHNPRARTNNKNNGIDVNKIISNLYKTLNIDALIIVNFRYIEEYDFALVARDIQLPVIMLYRECAAGSPMSRKNIIKRMKKHSNYPVDEIIVANHQCKKMFIESNFIDPKKVYVGGAIRMDDYYRKIHSKKYSDKGKKLRVVFFHFAYNAGMFGHEGPLHCDDTRNNRYKHVSTPWPHREKFSQDIYDVLLRLAINNPNVEVIVKPKSAGGSIHSRKSWKFYEDYISKTLKGVGNLENYSVQPFANVHDLILSSTVIIGFHNSTVVESALSNKPVILPIFDILRNSAYFKDAYPFPDDIDKFDVPRDKEEMYEMIISNLQDSTVDKSILNKRRDFFINWFHNADGVSTCLYTNKILEIINNKCIKQ